MLAATVETVLGGEPLQVSIYTANQFGTPVSHLGTAVIREEDVLTFGDPDWPLSMFDLSDLEIDLVAGQDYFAAFRTETAVLNDARYRALRTDVNANSYRIPAYRAANGVSWDNAPFDSRNWPVGLRRRP